MKHIPLAVLAALGTVIGLALFAGKDDIRRLQHMRHM